MTMVVHYYNNYPSRVNWETISTISKSMSTGISSITECIRSIYPPRYGMAKSPHQCVSYRASKQLLLASALDMTTDPESVEL